MTVASKSVSAVLKLYDEPKSRMAASFEGKYDIMCDDDRNTDADGMTDAVEALIQFGKTYRVTIEEVEDEVS